MPTILPRIICVVGETATGKTGIAVEIAECFRGEIINADSMQVYRGMDIGAAKPSAEEQARVPFHIIDVVEPDDTFSAGRFLEAARKAIGEISQRGRLPVIAGGTGLYVKTLTHGLIDAPPINAELREKLRAAEIGNPGYLLNRVRQIDPDAADRLSPKDHVRLIRAIEVFEASGITLSTIQKRHRFAERKFNVLKLGLKRDPKDLDQRIRRRIQDMIDSGFENEVRLLMDRGIKHGDSSMAAVGYREMMKFIGGEIDMETAVSETIRGTKRLAKRQRTWFRADKEIAWFHMPGEKNKLMQSISDWLRGDPEASDQKADGKP
jgi:tRNA dimethylallyltransferase